MQDQKTFLVKGMVCNRCITVLKASLEELGLVVQDISLGKVDVIGMGNLKSEDQLNSVLDKLDFKIVIDRNQKIVNEIKIVIDSIFDTLIYSETKVKFSRLLPSKLNLNYDTLSSIFSRTEGLTLENYIIEKRIDKIKEFLVYTDYPLTQISFLMGYSSVFHLSSQFKEITSQNPSSYRKIREEKIKVISKAAEAKNNNIR